MNPQVLSGAISFIESWMRFQSERSGMPGFVIAINVDGKTVLQEGYGYANLETKEKMTPQHLFRVASHSKTFAATALMQLQEQGKLRIDDPVVQYLPWLAEHDDQRMKKVTIRQLMSHSAGMIRDGLDGDYWQRLRPFPNLEQLKKETMEAHLVLDSNVQMKYSNFGYSLLGLIIEAASGQTFKEYVEKNVLQPLDLKDTGVEFDNKIVDRLVTGYTRRDLNKQRKPLDKAISTEGMVAATGFYSTAENLCRYFNAHIVGSGKLLSDESKREMQRSHFRITNTKLHREYTLGFGVEVTSHRRLFGHGGGWPGQITRTLCDPEQRIVVCVLTNSIDGDALAMCKGIFSVFDQFEYSSEQASKRSLGDFARYEGRYMNLWDISDIIQCGDKLISFSPLSWAPFAEDIFELEYVDDTTFKVAKCEGYSEVGELVHFNFDKQGKVESIRFGPGTIWPEKKYMDRLAEADTAQALKV